MAEPKTTKQKKEKKEKVDLIKKYGDWGIDCTYGYEETINKLIYFDQIYHFNTYEVQKFIRLKMLQDGLKSDQRLLNNIVNYVKDMNHHAFNEFNQDLDILVTRNGTYYLKSRTFKKEFNPADFVSVQYGFNYDPAITTLEKCPKFHNFIKSINDYPAEMERLLYMLKYCLENQLIKMKAFLVLHGVTNSGKGTCIRLLQTLIGFAQCVAVKMTHAGNTFTEGDLLHMKLAFDADAAPDPWTGKIIQFLKTLTGIDLLHFEKKGKDTVTGKNTASFVMACNRIPILNVKDEVESVTSRAFFFWFKKTFPIVDHFEDFIDEEKDAIGSYLLNLPMKLVSKVTIDSNDIPQEYWKLKSNLIYAWCKKNILEVNHKTDYCYKQVEVIEKISSYLIDNHLEPDVSQIRAEITSRLMWVKGRKFFKQLNNEKFTWYIDVEILDCKQYLIDTTLGLDTVDYDTPATSPKTFTH